VFETAGSNEDDKNANVQAFLLCAEARYVRYLQLLESFLQTIDMKGAELVQEFNHKMPLPPWYIFTSQRY
jgi:hypothetical protein